MRVVNILQTMYPVSSIRLERNKFDPQLIMNPNINGVEYQRGTLLDWQIRAYVLDHGRCAYCRHTRVRLELDHVRPRDAGSNRVDNLVACCRECNLKKSNRPIEEFLANQPALLQQITERLQRSSLASATHITIESLPSRVLQLQPSNGRSKQKANVNRHGTPVGRPYREQQRLPKHLRQRDPAAGHSDRHQRYGPDQLSTGDTIALNHRGGQSRGRAVIKVRGTRVAVYKKSASIIKARIIARNPRHRIRWATPSQQAHHEPDTITLSAITTT